MANNNIYIGYKGIVDVSIRFKDKIFSLSNHNSGTEYLQESFARVLTGNYDKLRDTPQLLDLEYSIDGGNTWLTYLKSTIDITTKKVVNNAAVFNATIASSDLSEIIEEDSSYKYRFSINTNLLDSGNTMSFATINVEPELLSKIVPGSQAIVTWTMKMIILEDS